MRSLRAALVIASISAAPAARAQDLFELSPGPLTEAHAEWDNKDGCTKCHELGKGVTNFLCLDCHQHRPLKEAIEHKRGLHATFKEACRTCHGEHKGRDAFVIDWAPLGGRNNFNHAKTGFELTGKHQTAACAKCHKRKLTSGRISYVGLEPGCNDCHQNPHSFTSSALVEKCTDCHTTPGVAKKMKPAELPFDHTRKSGIALIGKHATLDCIRCHENAQMSFTRASARTCVDCHKNPHGKSFARWACTDCHQVDGPWKKSSFDHDQTDFPLFGAHEKAICGKCHQAKEKKPSTACASCHSDPHKKRFAKLQCESCHEKGGTEQMRFNHARQAGFALTGAHRGVGCRSCHRGSGPVRFEKLDEGEACMSCHRHKNAHQGQFDDKRCQECHREGGSKELVFDHQKDSRFPLTGFHAQLGEQRACEKCHSRGSFRNNKLLCGDCHQDSHRGELGADCTRCHKTDAHFADTKKTFDHDALTRFPLEGEHEKAACEKCHADRRYHLDKTTCISCHADDEPHRQKLGAECERCHTPAKGAPKFDHQVMTAFALDGAHVKTACSFCHRTRTEPLPPPIGWTKQLAVEPVNKLFPVMGQACADCHRDQHQGAYGIECASCHNTESFKQASRAVHDTGAFRLKGAHDDIACARCHTANRLLAGLGEMCQGCHREDDAHRNALGPFCGECHTQLDWRPPRFDHARVGFVLSGAHVMARCSDCHGVGRFAGTPSDCAFCHQSAASRVVDPVHNGSLSSCARCHNQVTFARARRDHPSFVLTGAHATTRCSSCHQGGVYEGTPGECSACHAGDYVDPSTRPNHVSAGYSMDCASCHNTVTFSGARAPRN